MSQQQESSTTGLNTSIRSNWQQKVVQPTSSSKVPSSSAIKTKSSPLPPHASVSDTPTPIAGTTSAHPSHGVDGARPSKNGIHFVIALIPVLDKQELDRVLASVVDRKRELAAETVGDTVSEVFVKQIQAAVGRMNASETDNVLNTILEKRNQLRMGASYKVGNDGDGDGDGDGEEDNGWDYDGDWKDGLGAGLSDPNRIKEEPGKPWFFKCEEFLEIDEIWSFAAQTETTNLSSTLTKANATQLKVIPVGDLVFMVEWIAFDEFDRPAKPGEDSVFPFSCLTKNIVFKIIARHHRLIDMPGVREYIDVKRNGVKKAIEIFTTKIATPTREVCKQDGVDPAAYMLEDYDRIDAATAEHYDQDTASALEQKENHANWYRYCIPIYHAQVLAAKRNGTPAPFPFNNALIDFGDEEARLNAFFSCGEEDF